MNRKYVGALLGAAAVTGAIWFGATSSYPGVPCIQGENCFLGSGTKIGGQPIFGDGGVLGSCSVVNGVLSCPNGLNVDAGCLITGPNGQLDSTCPLDPASGGVGYANFDCNFTTAPSQLLPIVDGGGFTACGQSGWTVQGVAFGTGRIDGGLIISCQDLSGSTDPSVVAGVKLPLSAIIPGFDSRTPFQVSARVLNPTNGSTPGNYEFFGIINEPLAGPATETYAIVARQFNEWFGRTNSSSGSTQTLVATDTTLGGVSPDTGGEGFPSGLGVNWTNFTATFYDGGLPALGSEYLIGFSSIGAEGSGTNNVQFGQPSLYQLILGCVNGGGGTQTAQFAEVKVEYQRIR